MKGLARNVTLVSCISSPPPPPPLPLISIQRQIDGNILMSLFWGHEEYRSNQCGSRAAVAADDVLIWQEHCVNTLKRNRLQSSCGDVLNQCLIAIRCCGRTTVFVLPCRGDPFPISDDWYAFLVDVCL